MIIGISPDYIKVLQLVFFISDIHEILNIVCNGSNDDFFLNIKHLVEKF